MVETIFGMPNHPIYTLGGQHFFAQGGWGNALAQAQEAATAHFNTRSVGTNFKAIVDVVEGLKLNLQAGIDYRTQNNTDIGKSFPLYKWDNSGVVYYSIANPDQNWVTKSDSEGTHRNYIGYLQYSKLFADKHQVEIMAGASHEDSDIDQFTTRAEATFSTRACGDWDSDRLLPCPITKPAGTGRSSRDSPV